jgi:hypothetical protein
MRKKITLGALMLLSGCASAADAGRLVDIRLINRSTGERMETYQYQGRTYVAGNPGDRYAVSIGNRSGGRVLTALSVDGINAISGETAAASQSGYVLNPWSSAEIRGWRKSMDDVAAFYFTSLPDSYAARTGRPDNVGVIGVAVFREYVEPRAELERRQDLAAKRAPAAAAGNAAGEMLPESKATMKDERLGTGHGERMNDPTRYTEFRRASDYPAEVLTIYYDSRANLIARGVIRRAPHHAHPRPQPFPGGFTPDPRSQEATSSAKMS